jgi:hypothetical protein
MTDLIVVISRDDTFMHIGPPDKVAEHLFGDKGDIALLPAPEEPDARVPAEHTEVGVGVRFGDLDTFDEAGRPLEWAVNRNLRPRHVHPVPDAEPDPAALLERIRAVVAHLNAEIAARPDLGEFREAFYAERLVSPPDLSTAVNTFADLGRHPPADDPPVPGTGRHGHGHDVVVSPPSRLTVHAAGRVAGRAHRLPDHDLGSVGTGGGLFPTEPPPEPGDVGTIPHTGSWFHNLMHRITGS